MTSRSVALFVAASAVLALACGGTPSPSPQNGPSSNDKGSRKDLRDDGPASSKADPSTAALLDKLLADTPSSHPTPPPPPSHTPTVAPAPKPAPAAHGDNSDSFEEDVRRIKETVPGWDNGTGIGVRFLKEATGTHLSLIYVDPTPPALNKELGMWVIEAAAKVDGKVVGRIAILSKSLEPGRYEGAPDKKGLIMISAVAEKIDLKDGETMMSTNAGSWSELVLRPGKKAGHIEGNFRAKLVSNNGQSFQTIESGFIYMNKLGT